MRTYGGWQANPPGVLGFPPQIIAGAVGVTLLLVPLLAHSWALLAFFGPLALVALASAVIRVGGRSALEWSGVVRRYLFVAATVGTEYVAPAVHRTEDAGGRRVRERRRDPTRPWDLPGTAASLRLLLGKDEVSGRPMVIVHHPGSSTYTAVAEVRFPGTVLLEEEAVDRRVARWGQFLAQQCQDDAGLARISLYQWIEPGEDDALANWIRRHRSNIVAPEVADMVEHLAHETRQANMHRRTWIAISISAAKSRRDVRGFGGGDQGAGQLLVKRASATQGALQAAGLELDHWLSPLELVNVLHAGYDPSWRADAEAGVELPPELAGPSRTTTRFGSYLHDGWATVTSELEWAKSPRDSGVLAALLSGDEGTRRVVSLHCEPVSMLKAARALGAAQTMADVKVQVRRKSGRIERAEHRRSRAITESQDQELAAGAGIVNFSGLVAVTAPAGADMDGALANLRNDAARGSMVLRRCAGFQDAAFVSGVLPVGLGIPARSAKLGLP